MYVIFTLITAFGFGGWPVLARLAGTTAAWTNVILMTVTAACMIAYNAPALRTDPLDGRQIAIMTAAALFNSVALVVFGILLQKQPQYIPVAQSLMPAVTVVGSALLLGERMTWQNGLGIVLIAVGIYLITKK